MMFNVHRSFIIYIVCNMFWKYLMKYEVKNKIWHVHKALKCLLYFCLLGLFGFITCNKWWFRDLKFNAVSVRSKTFSRVLISWYYSYHFWTNFIMKCGIVFLRYARAKWFFEIIAETSVSVTAKSLDKRQLGFTLWDAK